MDLDARNSRQCEPDVPKRGADLTGTESPGNDGGDASPDGPCRCDDLWASRPCGRGDDNARSYRDEVVHWRGSHWRAGCAFEAARAEVERLGEALKILAFEPDSRGYTYGSMLHDVGHMADFAQRVLRGAAPHDAVDR